MTAPQRSRRLDGNVRGLIVLGVAVLIGFLLLANAGDDGSTNVTTSGPSDNTTAEGSEGEDGGTPTTAANGGGSGATVPNSTTTTAAKGGGQPTGTTRAPASVSVVVLNGSGGIKGVAGAATDKIKAKGYKTLEAGNAAPVDKTVVYYTQGFQADANAVAGVLGLAPTSVSAAPANPPAGSTGANVIVVLGKDTPPAT
jgi:LytR cell envelope-related transcriptional attenuator